MIERAYIFPVIWVEKVTDGDTYWLRLDVGFRQQMLVHTRLNGWDAPEKYRGSDFEKSEANRATYLVENWMESAGDNLWVRTHKDPDSFGRWLADVYRGRSEWEETETSLGEWLAGEELATPWPTRWRDAYDVTLSDPQ